MKKIKFIALLLSSLPVWGQVSGENSNAVGIPKISTEQAAIIVNNDTITANENLSLKPSIEDEAEFNTLINSEQIKKSITAKDINEWLKNDENDEQSLLLIKNGTDCNIVIHVVSDNTNIYKFPIAAHEKNAIMVKKGFYKLKANVCNLKYDADKDLNKNLLIALKIITEVK